MFETTYYFITFLWEAALENLPKKWSGSMFIHLPVMEAGKSQKWRAESPIVVTYIHRLSTPPPPTHTPQGHLLTFGAPPIGQPWY